MKSTVYPFAKSQGTLPKGTVSEHTLSLHQGPTPRHPQGGAPAPAEEPPRLLPWEQPACPLLPVLSGKTNPTVSTCHGVTQVSPVL